MLGYIRCKEILKRVIRKTPKNERRKSTGKIKRVTMKKNEENARRKPPKELMSVYLSSPHPLT